MAKPAASSIGLITCPTYFIGGFDSDVKERQLILSRIQEVYKELSFHGPIHFNLPVLNGLPIDIATYCKHSDIKYYAFSPFGRLEDYHNKTMEVVDMLMEMMDNASEIKFPNGLDVGYSPARIAKCYKSIASASDMMIIAGTTPIHDYWKERLKNRFTLYIDVEKLGS